MKRLLVAYYGHDMEAAQMEQQRISAVVKIMVQFGWGKPQKADVYCVCLCSSLASTLFTAEAAGKALSLLNGIPMGIPRFPSPPLRAPNDLAALQTALTNIGWFDWANCKSITSHCAYYAARLTSPLCVIDLSWVSVDFKRLDDLQRVLWLRHADTHSNVL
jgi:hypothetical protein